MGNKKADFVSPSVGTDVHHLAATHDLPAALLDARAPSTLVGVARGIRQDTFALLTVVDERAAEFGAIFVDDGPCEVSTRGSASKEMKWKDVTERHRARQQAADNQACEGAFPGRPIVPNSRNTIEHREARLHTRFSLVRTQRLEFAEMRKSRSVRFSGTQSLVANFRRNRHGVRPIPNRFFSPTRTCTLAAPTVETPLEDIAGCVRGMALAVLLVVDPTSRVRTAISTRQRALAMATPHQPLALIRVAAHVGHRALAYARHPSTRKAKATCQQPPEAGRTQRIAITPADLA